MCSFGDTSKTDIILDFISSSNFDIVFLSETWLKNNTSDAQKIAKISPLGYQFLHRPRSGGHSGGLVYW